MHKQLVIEWRRGWCLLWQRLDEVEDVGVATHLLELLLCDLLGGPDGTEKDVEPMAEKTVDMLEVGNLTGAKPEDEGDEEGE